MNLWRRASLQTSGGDVPPQKILMMTMMTLTLALALALAQAEFCNFSQGGCISSLVIIGNINFPYQLEILSFHASSGGTFFKL